MMIWNGKWFIQLFVTILESKANSSGTFFIFNSPLSNSLIIRFASGLTIANFDILFK